jgi:hypothetical protein
MSGAATIPVGQTSAVQLEVVKESLAGLALRVNQQQEPLVERRRHHHQATVWRCC